MSNVFEDIKSGVNNSVGHLVQNVTLGAIDNSVVENALDSGQNAIDSITGKTQANAIKEGSAIEQDYLNRALDFQKEIYGDLQADQEPWKQAGLSALDQLSAGMGMAYQPTQYQPLSSNSLSDIARTGSANNNINPQTRSYNAGLEQKTGFDGLGDALKGLVSVGSSVADGRGTGGATYTPDAVQSLNNYRAEEAANREAWNSQAGRFDYNQFNAPQSTYTPANFTGSNIAAQEYDSQGYGATGYDATGYGATGYQGEGYDSTGYNAGSYAAQNYNAALQDGYNDFDFDYTKSPGYDFQQKEALEAVTNAMAARGLGSGGAEKRALMERAQGLAAQDYSNQYSRALQTHQNNYDQFYNQESSNKNALNQASQFNAGANNQAAQFNTGSQNQAAAFNAGAQNQASQFGANARNTANQFTAGAQNDAGQFYAGAQNSANQFNAEAANTASKFNAGENNSMSQFNAGQNMLAQQLNLEAARYTDQTGYDRYLDAYRADVANKDNQWNRLTQMANYGVNANAANQQAGSALASGSSNLLGQMGASQADSIYGAAGAQAQGINNMIDWGFQAWGAKK